MKTIQQIALEAFEEMRKIDPNLLMPILEIEDARTANILSLSNEFCQPRQKQNSEGKEVYAFVRKKVRA